MRAPRIALRWYLLYGLTISVGQFSLLFSAIHLGMPSGLASLVLQSQAFFTMILASLWLKEGFRTSQFVGLALSAAGLLLIGSAHGASMPLAGFVLTVMAAMMWATGNIVNRAMNRENTVNQFGFVVWASLVPILPLLMLSLLLEGPEAIGRAVALFDLRAFGATAYLAWAATLLGYGIWSRLMARYPAGSVAPLSLLVPVVGMSTGWLVFGETLGLPHAVGGLLVMLGLMVNVFGPRMLARLRAAAG